MKAYHLVCTPVFPSPHTHVCVHACSCWEVWWTTCTGSGDSHRMPLRCWKAVGSEAPHWRLFSLQQLPHPWEMKNNYRLPFPKLFEWWSFNCLHCFCLVLFSIFTTISRLKLNPLRGTKAFFFKSDKSGTQQFFSGPLSWDMRKHSTDLGRSKEKLLVGSALGTDVENQTEVVEIT